MTPCRSLVLSHFVLFPTILRALVVRRFGFQDVIVLSDPSLERQQLLHGDPAGLNVVDHSAELDPALEGTQYSIGGAGQSTLEDAHGQARGRLVQDFGLVVDVLQIFRRFVVEPLLALLALGQIVGKGIGDAPRIERLTGQFDHLFFDAPDEVLLPVFRGKLVEGFRGCQHLRLQQAPQGVVRIVLPHMGRRRQQKQMVRVPWQLPCPVAGVNPGNRLSQAISIRLADAEVASPVTGKLVGFVENHKLVRLDLVFLKPGEHSVSGQGIDAHDQLVAQRSREGIIARTSLPLTMSNCRLNRVENSCCQFPTNPAGETIRTRVSRRRESISRM